MWQWQLRTLTVFLILTTGHSHTLYVGGGGWAAAPNDGQLMLLEATPCPPLTIDLHTLPRHPQETILTAYDLSGVPAIAVQLPNLDLVESLHFALVINEDGSWRTYINGLEQVSASDSLVVSVETISRMCTGSPAVAKWMLGGMADELHWWSRNLSSAEIQKWMTLTPAEDEPDLVRRWSFETPSQRDPSVAAPPLELTQLNRVSPFPVVGGPVALLLDPLTDVIQARVCAAVQPPAPDTTATACFSQSQLLQPVDASATGSPNCMLTVDLLPEEAPTVWDNDTVVSPPVISLLCASVRFQSTSTSTASEEVPFAIVAEVPDSGRLEAQQVLDVRVQRQRARAGWNGAVLFSSKMLDGTGGTSNTGGLSLGRIDLPTGDEAAFSLSLWMLATLNPPGLERSRLLVQHSAESGLFAFGVGSGRRYQLGMNCRRTCNGGNGAEGWGIFPPEGRDVVLPGGILASKVLDEVVLPHLLTATVRCHSRGNDDPNGRPASSTVTLYVDGVSLGEQTVPACWELPSGAAGWWLGDAFSGYIDDVHFWSRELNPGEVQTMAQGGAASRDQLLAHFNLDYICRNGLACQGHDACQRQAVADCIEWVDSVPAPDTDQRTAMGVAHTVTPFSLLPSAETVVDVCAETCVEYSYAGHVHGNLQPLTPINRTDMQVQVTNLSLSACVSPLPGVIDVQVPMVACSPAGCDSSVVTFHALPEGPAVSRLQLVPQFQALRILFTQPTNTPSARDLAGIVRLLNLTLPADTAILPDRWEVGGQVLRLSLTHENNVGTPPAWMDTVLRDPLGDLAANVSRAISASLTEPSPLMVADGQSCNSRVRDPVQVTQVLFCGEGSVLLPGQPSCSVCPAGTQASLMESACNRCSRGRYQPLHGKVSCQLCPLGRFAEGEGAQNCTPCSEVLPGSSTPHEGSQDSSSCTCPPGTAWARQSPDSPAWCKACGPGLLCLGGLQERSEAEVGGGYHQPPLQAEGFAAGRPPWVGGEPAYLVRCGGRVGCPSGLPLGSCAPLATGRACALCSSGSYRNNGRCLPCEEVSFVLSVLAPLVALIVVPNAINWVGSRPPAIFCSHGASLSSSCSIGFAALQVVGALTAMQVPWPEPMPSLRNWLSLLALNIDQQRLQCMLGFDSPLISYLGVLTIYPAIATCLTCSLLFRQFVMRRKVRRAQAINMHGLCLASIFTSLTAACIMPLKCPTDNPDGSPSVEAYRSVVCWTTTEHLVMVFTSLFVCLVLILGFASVLIWATLAYPSMISRPSGGEHLVRFRFLFGPFSPERFYFGLFFSLRKLMIALVPMLAVNVPQAQLLFVMLVISGNLSLQCALWPWRTFTSNFCDAATGMFLIVLIMAGFMTGDFNSEDNDKVAKWLGLLSMISSLVAFLLLLAHYVWKWLRGRRTYHIFLSHHKVGAGLLARWLKMLLVERGETAVFLDSDDLLQLDKLINIVAYDTENVVVLLTQETLSRPWCAMELAAAYKAGTRVIPVHCDGYGGVTDALLSSLPTLWTPEQQTTMTTGGISMAEVHSAYVRLRAEEELVLPRAGADPEVHMSAVKQILKICRQGPAAARGGQFAVHHAGTKLTVQLTQTGRTLVSFLPTTSTTSTSRSKTQSNSIVERTRVAILSDMGTDEGACACRVIQHMLQEHLQESVLIVSGCASSWPPCILVVLRVGIFMELNFAEALTKASEDPSVQELVPLLFGDFCDFPGSSFWTSLRNGEIWSFADLKGKGLNVRSVEAAYRRLFARLAMRFSGHGSADIQNAQIVSMVRQIQVSLEADSRSADEQRVRTDSDTRECFEKSSGVGGADLLSTRAVVTSVI